MCFQCPECKSNNLVNKKNFILCKSCEKKYPIIFNAVPDFTPLAGYKNKKGYSYTYSYSSKLYEYGRKSFLMKISTGLSFAEENKLLLKNMQLLPDSGVLDIGCGTGIFTRQFAKICSNTKVWGLDYSYSQLKQAIIFKKKEKIKNLFYVHSLATRIPFKNEYFDRVSTVGAMQFFKDFKLFFSEVYRVLKKGGIFVAINYVTTEQKFWLLKKVQKISLIKNPLFTKKQLEDLSIQAGFKVENYTEKGLVFILRVRK